MHELLYDAGETLKSGPYLGPKSEANAHEVYNQFIEKGYRINYKTWRQTIGSLFHCHNETVNVWTHFIGFWAALITMLVISFSNLGEINSVK